jgi:hypothetical protein
MTALGAGHHEAIMRGAVCVFCSSSDTIAPEFFAAATELGEQIARNDYSLVFGGTDVGLMGAVARSTHQHGGRVVGVLPEAFEQRKLAYKSADELIITRDLRERKATMEGRANAFVALPGGFGTLEEVLEIITLKQLRFHNKPIVLLNTGGFYDHLAQFFERLMHDRFAKNDHPNLYHITSSPTEALAHIDQWV